MQNNLGLISADEAETGAKAFWDFHNSEEGFPQKYPDEEVVRFIARSRLKDFRVLDLGAGSGKHVGVALDFGARVVCLDYAKSGLTYIESQFRSQRVSVIDHDLREADLPFDDSQFEIIIASQIFDHILKRHAYSLATKISRILSPGGRLLVTLFTDETNKKSKVGFPVDGEERTVVVGTGNSSGEIHSFFNGDEIKKLTGLLNLELNGEVTVTQLESDQAITQTKYLTYVKGI